MGREHRRGASLAAFVTVLLVFNVCLALLKPACATFPGLANGKIAFSRNTSTDKPRYEIFTVNPDGSGLTQLTFSGSAFNIGPRWSADGRKIVFMSDRSGPGFAEIWVMNADGSGQTQITFTPNAVSTSPAFSPDGSKIVFASDQPPSTQMNIWVMNADGTGQVRLTTTTSGFETSPVWSPDGSKIVFEREITIGLSHIFVMNLDGTGQTDISKNPNYSDIEPEWSPDGRMIAFSRQTNIFGNAAVWVMNADGSGSKQLVSASTRYPAWSPDGTKIAFVRTGFSIWVMNAYGLNPVDITKTQPNSDTDGTLNWQPLAGALPKPVGGVTLPINKLEMLAPFVALAGLVAAVSAVVVVKRRRD